jgi:arylsulfatase A-like enzyme
VSKELATVLLAGVVFAVACRPVDPGNRRNLLLITLETTRADHLGIYGYPRDTSPRIDRLAEEGVVFERFFAVSPRTNPSLASLMTSRYPHEHGVRNLLLPLEPPNRTLAELLREAGYITAAIQTHPRLVEPSGFAQGFEQYRLMPHMRASAACAAAGAWIQESSRGDRPWFLWLHIMDPHWTYDPPDPWRTRFGPADPRPGAVYDAVARGEITFGSVIFQNRMPPDEVDAFVALYDAEIRLADDALGDLLDLLDRLGLRQETVVALTADHGESLGEDDYFFEHGDFGTDAEIRIPLVLVAPSVLPGGRRVPATAESLDLAPTLLELLGLPSDDRFRGRSLLPLVEGDESGDRTCFGETGKRFHEENDRREIDGVVGKRRWIRRGDFKLVHIPRVSNSPERRLHQLSSGDWETVDVADEYPEVAEELGAELDAWLAEDPGVDREVSVTPEEREQLRALGYLN